MNFIYGAAVGLYIWWLRMKLSIEVIMSFILTFINFVNFALTITDIPICYFEHFRILKMYIFQVYTCIILKLVDITTYGYIYIYIYMPLSGYDKSSISAELVFKKQCPKCTANSFMETKCSLPYSQQLTKRLSSVSHCHASTLHKTSFNIILPSFTFLSEISRPKFCKHFLINSMHATFPT